MYFFPALLFCFAPTGCAGTQPPGALSHYDLAGPASRRIALPVDMAEISGLAYTPDGRLFAHGDEQAVVYEIDLARGRPVRLLIPQADLQRATGVKSFAGSAITRHPRTGTYLLLAGPQRAYAEIDSTGKVLGGGKLPADRHRQPEGIAIAPDGTLLIGDEAAGKTAMITGYAYRP